MRSSTPIHRWISVTSLWLGLLGPAWTQDVPPAASPGAVTATTAPAPLVLGGEDRAIPLDRRARYFIDVARHPTPDAIEVARDRIAWRLLERDTSYGIDGAALWFQFDATSSAGRWFLQVGSSGVDRVQLFYRGSDGRWVVEEAGDSRAVSEWPLPGRLPTFALAPPSDNAVRYWLRIEHDRGDFVSPLVIYDQSQLIASRETEQFLLGGYFSLALLIALGSVANAVVYRDRNFAAYAVYVGALALAQLAYLGVGAQHVWDRWLQWNSMAGFVLPSIARAAALWFTRTVTEPARFSRALDMTVWGVIAALLCAVALDTLLTSRLSLMLVVVLNIVALMVIATLIGVVWTRSEDPHVGLIALGFLPVLVFAIFPILRGFNLIPVSLFTRYSLAIGAVLEMPILFYALSLRGNRRREAQVRASALAWSDALTGLAHTQTLLQRLEAALERCVALKQTCGLMGVKIANFQAILDEYDRDTAERVLVVAASMLRKVTTDVDTAARVGDHEFVLLLEGPASTADVTSRAQKLVASGLRDSEALPTGLVLKFQVATALLPDRGLDAPGSLKWLRDAAHATYADTRKLIRALNF
ncbi:MAG: 7TM diverse intracellular signaling domain-containing protein [Ramlibacter sp.]